MNQPFRVIMLSAGRLVCPLSGIDGPGTVVVHHDRIHSVIPSSSSDDAADRPSGRDDVVQLRFPDAIVLPGLCDLHAHPACRVSVFGVSPDQHLLPCGVTTVQSQGDAGADDVDNFVQHTIQPSRTRVLLSLNLSRIGETSPHGCFADLEHADVAHCVAAVRRHREHIRSLSVNVSHHACGNSDPREVQCRGLEAAAETGLPLLFGMRRPEDWPLADQLNCLRPGDVVTYCFRRAPHCIVQAGRVLPCIRTARERGILFDVGHGMASFSFDVAEAAIADGFAPDTISTDLQQAHLRVPPRHALPLVMSKLCAVGMSESAVFAAVTKTPAAILGLTGETSSLTPGACADLTILNFHPPGILRDAHGVQRCGAHWSPRLTIRAGQMILPPDVSQDRPEPQVHPA